MDLILEFRALNKLEIDDNSKDTALTSALNAAKSYIENYTGDIFFSKEFDLTRFVNKDTTAYLFPFAKNVLITKCERYLNGEWIEQSVTTIKRSSLLYVLGDFYAGYDYKFTLSAGYEDDNIPGEIKDILFDIAMLTYNVKNDNRVGVTSNVTNLNGNIAQVSYTNDLKMYETRLKKYRKITL